MDECFLTESSVMQLNGNDDWDAVVGSDSFVFPVDDNGVVQETEEFDVLAVQMDISENLAKLKLLLGEKLACDLSYYQIWLQDIIEMDENSTLAEQCVQGEGTVQINVELKIVDGKDRINILDVLKPHEAAPPSEILPDDPSPIEEPVPETPVSTTPAAALQNASSENITRWVMDVNYRKEQDRRNIPYDPAQWSKENVMFWVNWAASHFKLNIDRMQWENMDGVALCKMTHADFKTKITQDPNDLFWTHLELLRKCKFVGVIQKPVPYLQYVTTPLNVKTEQRSNSITNKGLLPKQKVPDNSHVSASNRTGNNGQVQLWQFLLELLTDKSARQAISWLGTDGEFRLNNPELVAQLWGERKNKPQMNYEKLSRALRYYYDGEMICKVPGKRFVYKFVCDLKELLGYSAEELSNLVNSTINC